MKPGSTTKYLLLLIAVCWFGSVPAQTLFRSLPAGETGLQFSNDISESENLNVLAYEYFYNGGGVAAGDVNNDGLTDLYFSANMRPNRLFLNLGGMQFKDITATAGVGGREGTWKTGVTMADVNDDGLLDIYVCYSGKLGAALRRNQLFINKGNNIFKDEAAAYGLDDAGFSTQAAFFDMDNDGDLDMFLLNHSTQKIDNLEFTRFRAEVDSLSGNKLFENRNNRFFDVSKAAGIHQSPLTFGLGIAIADINQDGWQDIYVTNDYNEQDFLYINNRNGSFRETSQTAFTHLSHFSMGVDIADFNNDALPDVLTLDMLPEDNRRQKLLQLQENYESFQLMQSQGLHRQYMRNMLQLNNGDGSFSEIGQLAGISNTDWSWSPLFADFDNDGYKDVFITNGYLRDYTNKDFLRYWGDYKIKKAMDREPTKLMDLVTAMPSTTLSNYIFQNNQDLGFTNKKNDWGITDPGISSGAVYADLDNDGDLDLVVNRINQPAAIYRNNSQEQTKNNFARFSLTYKAGNRRAIGSKVYIYTGNRVQYQELNPSRGYLSCMPATLHFGLGNTAVIDSVRIVWPDNKTQLLKQVATGNTIAVNYQPAGEKQPPAKPAFTWFQQVADLIAYRNESFEENDFKRQLLMLFMYSKTGPVLATADVNNDGLTDVFISGGKSAPGMVYIQQKNGRFVPTSQYPIGDEESAATSGAVFADVNNDGYPDLYIAHGGYSLFQANTPALQDELYLNDGKGNFGKSQGALPDVSASSKSCVRACDYDKDGDIDFFVGGRVIPGKYPFTPTSYLLNNNGKGQFTIASTPFHDLGMVTDASWYDMDGDGRKDLVLCGEFMPVTVFLNTTGGFVNRSNDYVPGAKSGIWFSLQVADLNGDRKPDIIAGNMGGNTQLKFSASRPLDMYFSDFDNNGSVDVFVNSFVKDTSYPFVSRDELNEQIYSMRKKFTSYKDYANATMQHIFTPQELSVAGKLSATQQHSVCYVSGDGGYSELELPAAAQFSVVTKIIAQDFNHDGKTDLLLLGNRSDNRLKIGAIDANFGCLLEGNGDGRFRYVPQPNSGLSIRGDVKSAEMLQVGSSTFLLAGVADGPLQCYKIN